jgi:hypothetical protein
MAKHNIDAIAAATIAAQDAYVSAVAPAELAVPPTEPAAVEARRSAERIRVLEEIHNAPPKKDDDAALPETERRTRRLFSAIVKALTIRL